MIHPHTRLQFINEAIGYGVYATAFIPKGAITYAQDPLESVVSSEEFARFTPSMQRIVERYSYRDAQGFRVLSWDLGKYVNHNCHCNTISTGYGFEIAIRDIYPGEEITDEYGIFNIEEPIQVTCGHEDCRGVVRREDFDEYYREWDEKIRPALALVASVEQPLLPLVDEQTWSEVKKFLADPDCYKSVYTLKYCELSADPTPKNGVKIPALSTH